MYLLFYFVALAVTIALLGVSAWAFAMAFRYLTRQLHKAVVCALQRVQLVVSRTSQFGYNKAIVPTSRFTAKWICFGAVVATRSVKAVMQKKSSKEQPEQDAVEEDAQTVILSEPQPEFDWDQFEVPAFIRKGNVLVW